MRALYPLAALLLGLAHGGSAHAQASAPPDTGGWTWDVTMYLLGASMDGTSGVNGFTADVDFGFDEIFENLELGAMGRVRASRGPWGFGLDVIYAGLGVATDRPPADVDVDQTIVELSVAFRFNEYFESVVGARYNDLSTDIQFQGPLGVQRSGDIDWWDPFLGGNVRVPFGEQWSLRVRADVGGFGVGSDLAWQLETLFDWHLSDRTSFEFGYRWIDVDYEDDDVGFVYDMLTHGLQAGVTFRF